MKIALVDMDQTLCDYEGTIKNKIKEYLQNQDLVICNLDYYEEIASKIKKTPGFWKTLPEIELGFKIINILKSYGYDIHVLTKGPYNTTSAWTEKVEWCREHLPGVPVTITENKSLVYGKILVDDWPEYCEQWLKHRPRGQVIMPAYSYNEGFDKKYHGRVIRTDGTNLNRVEEIIKWVSENYLDK